MTQLDTEGYLMHYIYMRYKRLLVKLGFHGVAYKRAEALLLESMHINGIGV